MALVSKTEAQARWEKMSRDEKEAFRQKHYPEKSLYMLEKGGARGFKWR